MIQRKDLVNGDIIVSRKPSSDSIIQALFNSACASVGKRRYGYSGIHLESSHVRGVMRNPNSLAWEVFHWTNPKAEVAPLEGWMLDPSYAIIVRPYTTYYSSRELILRAWEAAGRRYNYGLLLDIFFGYKFELFSLGLSNEVCSTGVGSWMGLPLISPAPYHLSLEEPILPRRFIPADFINNPMYFARITSMLDVPQKLKLEPK